MNTRSIFCHQEEQWRINEGIPLNASCDYIWRIIEQIDGKYRHRCNKQYATSEHWKTSCNNYEEAGIPLVRDARRPGVHQCRRCHSCVCRGQTHRIRLISFGVNNARAPACEPRIPISEERKRACGTRAARMFNVTLSNNARSGLGQPSMTPSSFTPCTRQTRMKGRAEPRIAHIYTYTHLDKIFLSKSIHLSAYHCEC